MIFSFVPACRAPIVRTPLSSGEQGPNLEDNAKSMGVVSGGPAIRWLDVRVEGMA
ncbi:hypothetical protein [Pseudomonas sp. NPDC089569]|uniref:hypothetical protein n=1 Tax=Pseudomonas sp. NPDC089569 TaxID=3390722 RepID=UPI003D047CDD